MKRRTEVRYRALKKLSLKEDRHVLWEKGDWVEHPNLTPERLQTLLDIGALEAVALDGDVIAPAAELPTVEMKEMP